MFLGISDLARHNPTTPAELFFSPIFMKFGYVINSKKINFLYFAEKF